MKAVVKEFQPEYDFDQPVRVRSEKRDWKESKIKGLELQMRTRHEPMMKGETRNHTRDPRRQHRAPELEDDEGRICGIRDETGEWRDSSTREWKNEEQHRARYGGRNRPSIHSKEGTETENQGEVETKLLSEVEQKKLHGEEEEMGESTKLSPREPLELPNPEATVTGETKAFKAVVAIEQAPPSGSENVDVPPPPNSPEPAQEPPKKMEEKVNRESTELAPSLVDTQRTPAENEAGFLHIPIQFPPPEPSDPLDSKDALIVVPEVTPELDDAERVLGSGDAKVEEKERASDEDKVEQKESCHRLITGTRAPSIPIVSALQPKEQNPWAASTEEAALWAAVTAEQASTNGYARRRKQRCVANITAVELWVSRTSSDPRPPLEPPDSGPSMAEDRSAVMMADETAPPMSPCRNGVKRQKQEGGVKMRDHQWSLIVNLMGQAQIGKKSGQIFHCLSLAQIIQKKKKDSEWKVGQKNASQMLGDNKNLNQEMNSMSQTQTETRGNKEFEDDEGIMGVKLLGLAQVWVSREIGIKTHHCVSGRELNTFPHPTTHGSHTSCWRIVASGHSEGAVRNVADLEAYLLFSRFNNTGMASYIDLWDSNMLPTIDVAGAYKGIPSHSTFLSFYKAEELIRRNVAKEAAEKELQEFAELLAPAKSMASQDKPPKSSWIDDEKIWRRIESLEAYALDSCKNDEQKKVAGMILKEMGLERTSSSAVDVLVEIGYFPVHVNLDWRKSGTPTDHSEEIVSVAKTHLSNSSYPDEIDRKDLTDLKVYAIDVDEANELDEALSATNATETSWKLIGTVLLNGSMTSSDQKISLLGELQPILGERLRIVPRDLGGEPYAANIFTSYCFKIWDPGGGLFSQQNGFGFTNLSP